jgi:hypothetical protein
MYAIQLTHAHSNPVVAVCSEKHFKLCKSIGASQVFDYRDEKVDEKVKAAVLDIMYVFDCIGARKSSAQASRARLRYVYARQGCGDHTVRGIDLLKYELVIPADKINLPFFADYIFGEEGAHHIPENALIMCI